MMVQAKPPKVWEQEFARLSYEWEKVYAYGDADSMCTDGAILNRIRQELIEMKEKLDAMGGGGVSAIPPEVQKGFMACADEIRMQAQSAVQEYLALEDYRAGEFVQTFFGERPEGAPESGSFRESEGPCGCACRR